MNATARADQVPPSGTVTFLFSDVQGSTRLLHELGNGYAEVLAQHRRVLRAAFSAHDGVEMGTEGDSFFVAFARASDAVAAAAEGQRGLLEGPMQVRMGLHTGEPLVTPEGYVGMVVHRAARIAAIGHGGQVLLSQAVATLVEEHMPVDVTLRDLGSIRLKDLASPERIYQLLHPQLPEEFPALRSLEATPNNLPQQLTSFIGREKAIADIKALLGKTRLLTLTGSGGSGKTRLSLQVAAETLEQFPDGVWFVELAPLADPNLVPQAVASVLGVKEEPRKPITQTLAENLKHMRLVLLLDNCEHLLDACAKLADTLMRQCPGVKLLASSREALGISGEQTYPVPSLSLPDRKQTQTPQTLSQYESVHLFIDRALSVRPDFQVTNQNAPAVASLCHHLDGIPLAIELAAARARSLAVEEIDQKLDQRFRLLTGGSRTALPRQQTLRACIDWSCDLLHDPEKQLLRRLSVFAGGWTLEAAAQVCAGEGVADWEVLDLLTSLSDKSLVAAEQVDGHSRYRLLETVRQYARERLMESGRGELVRERHWDYFLALAEKAEPQLLGAEQAHWLQRLEQEHENLRAGLDWSLEGAGSAGGLRLCAALQRFWVVRGHLAEGREWCERVLRKAGHKERTLERANALNASGTLAHFQGDDLVAGAQHEESLAIMRELGDQRGIARSLNSLGNIASVKDDHASARALYEESIAIWRQLGDRVNMAGTLINVGRVAQDQGDYRAARAQFEEGEAIMRELGHGWGIANSLDNLGHMALEQGDYPAARARFEETLAIMRGLGGRRRITNSLDNLGNVAFEQGDYLAAGALHEESLAIRRKLDDRMGIASSLEELAGVAASLGRSIRAARIWGAAKRLREEIGSPLPTNERPRFDRRVAAARSALGDDAAFDRAWQEGRALTLEQAIELALAESVERP